MDFQNNGRDDVMTQLAGVYQAYRDLIVVGVMVVVIAIGGGGGWWYHRQVRENEAHKAYAQLAQEVASAGDSAGAWGRIVQDAGLMRENHGGTAAEGLIAAAQAHALVELGQLPEALEVYKFVASKAQEDIKPFYEITVALLQLDIGDAAGSQEGLETLKRISSGPDYNLSLSYDLALYRLGEYFWTRKNFDQARNFWGQLIVSTEKDKDLPDYRNGSPWAAKAREHLALIDYR